MISSVLPDPFSLQKMKVRAFNSAGFLPPFLSKQLSNSEFPYYKRNVNTIRLHERCGLCDPVEQYGHGDF